MASRLTKFFVWLAAIFTMGMLFFIVGFILWKGIPAMNWDLFAWEYTTKNVSMMPLYGILPFVLGSIYVTLGSIIVGVPIGILTAIFMAYFCPDPLYRVLKPAINLMAAIPSIVYGFFALQIFKTKFSNI